MPVSSYSMTMLDQTKERYSHTFPVRAVTAVTLPDILTDGTAYEAAVAAVVLGTQRNRKLVAFNNENVTLPVDAAAQVEVAWIVHYHDNTQYFDPPTNAIFNENYTVPETIRIATAKLTDATLREPNSDLAKLTDARWIAFITAFQDLALSRGGGQVVVDFIELSRGAK